MFTNAARRCCSGGTEHVNISGCGREDRGNAARSTFFQGFSGWNRLRHHYHHIHDHHAPIHQWPLASHCSDIDTAPFLATGVRRLLISCTDFQWTSRISLVLAAAAAAAICIQKTPTITCRPNSFLTIWHVWFSLSNRPKLKLTFWTYFATEICTLCSEKTPTHIFFHISILHELFMDLKKNCNEYTQGSIDSENVKIRYSLRSMT